MIDRCDEHVIVHGYCDHQFGRVQNLLLELVAFSRCKSSFVKPIADDVAPVVSLPDPEPQNNAAPPFDPPIAYSGNNQNSDLATPLLCTQTSKNLIVLESSNVASAFHPTTSVQNFRQQCGSRQPTKAQDDLAIAPYQFCNQLSSPLARSASIVAPETHSVCVDR